MRSISYVALPNKKKSYENKDTKLVMEEMIDESEMFPSWLVSSATFLNKSSLTSEGMWITFYDKKNWESLTIL